MYVHGIKVGEVNIAKTWLKEHKEIPNGWENSLRRWFDAWVKDNNAITNRMYNDPNGENLRNSYMNEIRNHYVKEIEHQYEIECPNEKKTKGWLRRYRQSDAYAQKLEIKLLENKTYQMLLRPDFADCPAFKERLFSQEKASLDTTYRNIKDYIEKELKRRFVEEAKQYFDSLDLIPVLKDLDLQTDVINRFELYLIQGKNIIGWYYNSFFYNETETVPQRVHAIVHKVISKKGSKFLPGYKNIAYYVVDRIKEKDETLAAYIKKDPKLQDIFVNKLESDFQVSKKTKDILLDVFTEEHAVQCLLKNPKYRETLEEALKKEEIRKQVKESILNRIPENYEDLYPLARRMDRHFILHIGPTNSGKTYRALEEFRNAKVGIYMAPLRLLAYEVYEDSNQKGCLCNMVTGEEELTVNGAVHTACTIETADLCQQYDVCVIDEAQMLGDQSRGGAWTAAILGVCAKVIHVCASLNAKDILIELIEQCGDTYEIENHERSVPLKLEKESFLFPKDVRKHDALIVFSKRSVLQVAAELQKANKKVSVIYGGLPYESRRKEVTRFVSGETDIVVATDAIGMGMNLPIQRIVFLETDKFDGEKIRCLNEQEIKQVAGRAGRRGIYNEGLVNAEYDKSEILNGLKEKPKPLKEVYLDFPSTLLPVNGKLSELLTVWKKIPDKDIFSKRNLDTEIDLAEELENYTDNKSLVYSFVTIPLNVNIGYLKELWYQLFFIELKRERPESYIKQFLISKKNIKSMALDELEQEYKKCDLLYNYLRKFNISNEREEVLNLKRKIANCISEILANQKLPGKRCRECGIQLPWNYPYPMCEICHDNLYNHRRYYGFDFDDDDDDEFWF